ncbi:MAG: hypothetical protein VKI42_07150 [Synechococcaceae cyanobacterium]|nr:hypothetical protein [Synechococcaceae cyanobacterium]
MYTHTDVADRRIVRCSQRRTLDPNPLQHAVELRHQWLHFFSTLKQELDLDDDAEILTSPPQLIRQLAFWIDGYYNSERRHSMIGYLSPIDSEQQFINTRTLTPVKPCRLSTESG